MVVDDDHDVRIFIGELLAELGHVVESFETGEAALGAIGERRPDLMLIDFAMPVMNGAELARAVRERHPDLPVAFVTGYAESEQLEGALGSDVPVLRKPFGLEEMSALVERMIRRDTAQLG
jgi:CheY-like chemotaxis protein